MEKRVMIITEQPNAGDRKNEDAYIPEIKNCKECENLRHCEIENPAICLKINYKMPMELYTQGSRFQDIMNPILDFLRERKIDYYWTHYIKHHTKDKGFSKNNKEWKKIGQTCARKWFEREIDEFKPTHIIIFGKEAWEGITEILKIPEISKEPKFYDAENKRIRVMSLPHPSPNNTHQTATECYGKTPYSQFLERFKNEFMK